MTQGKANADAAQRAVTHGVEAGPDHAGERPAPGVPSARRARGTPIPAHSRYPQSNPSPPRAHCFEFSLLPRGLGSGAGTQEKGGATEDGTSRQELRRVEWVKGVGGWGGEEEEEEEGEEAGKEEGAEEEGAEEDEHEGAENQGGSEGVGVLGGEGGGG